MTIIFESLIKWIIPFICGGVITGCITYVRTARIHNKAERDGLQCLLRAEIIRNHDKYMERGWCPIYARDALAKIYRAYHNLEGNDVATGLYNEIMDLPTEPPKK